MRQLILVSSVLLFFHCVVNFEQADAAQVSKKRDLSEKYYQPNLCGPISLYCICLQFDIKTTIKELIDLCEYESRPVSIINLTKAAKAKGLVAKPLNSSLRHLKRIGGPAIIDFPKGHFCVFLGWENGKALIQDPPRKVRSVSIGELKRLWGKHLITFTLANKKKTQ